MTLYSKNKEGFYLPSIKIWNRFYDVVSKNVRDGVVINGSVEDLLRENPKANCSECGLDLIRVQVETNGYFNVGIIQCPWAEHKNVWVEMWPDASAKISHKERQKLNSEEFERNSFRLSDPRVTECYSSIGLQFYAEYCELAREQGVNPEKPTPLFIHQ